MEKTIFVGTSVVFFAIVNYVKLIPYGLLGQLSTNNLGLSLLFAPLAPLGIWLGLAPRTPDSREAVLPLELRDPVCDRLQADLRFAYGVIETAFARRAPPIAAPARTAL